MAALNIFAAFLPNDVRTVSNKYNFCIIIVKEKKKKSKYAADDSLQEGMCICIESTREYPATSKPYATDEKYIIFFSDFFHARDAKICLKHI